MDNINFKYYCYHINLCSTPIFCVNSICELDVCISDVHLGYKVHLPRWKAGAATLIFPTQCPTLGNGLAGYTHLSHNLVLFPRSNKSSLRGFEKMLQLWFAKLCQYKYYYKALTCHTGNESLL